MKTTIKLLVLTISLMQISCIKHTEIVDSTYNIGNIYCSDGTILPIEDYIKQDIKKAVGVIFYKYQDNTSSPYKALVLALDEITPTTWSDSICDVGTSTDFNAMNGAENTYTAVLWALSNETHAYACQKAYEYNKFNTSAWFLPSVAEASEILKNKYILLHSLEECEGEPFLSLWYWTSTQDNASEQATVLNAMAVSFLNDAIMPSSKLNKFAIRPIMAIK